MQQNNNNNNGYNIWYGCILIYSLWCGLGPIVIDWIISPPHSYVEDLASLQCDHILRQGFEETIKVEWGIEVGSWSIRTIGSQERKYHVKTQWEGCKPGHNHAGTLILDFQPLGLWKVSVLWATQSVAFCYESLSRLRPYEDFRLVLENYLYMYLISSASMWTPWGQGVPVLSPCIPRL